MKPYQPDNSQATQRYGINSFQTVLLTLNGTDYSNGQLFPQYEGQFIYVEQADYPALITLVDKSTSTQLSYPLQPGMVIRSPFKGFSIQSPAFSVGAPSAPFVVKLIIGKDGDIEKNNDSAAPFSSFLGAFASTIVTPTLQQVTAHVPPGARVVQGVHINGSGTTIVQASIDFLGPNGNGSIGLTVNTPAQNFNLASLTRTYINVRSVNGTIYVAEYAQPILVPSNAISALINLTGTVLSAPTTVTLNFA